MRHSPSATTPPFSLSCHAVRLAEDFPEAALRPHGIEALSADEFIGRAIDAAPEQVAAIVEQQAADLKSPPCTVEQLLETLARNGLRRSAGRLRKFMTQSGGLD